MNAKILLLPFDFLVLKRTTLRIKSRAKHKLIFIQISCPQAGLPKGMAVKMRVTEQDLAERKNRIIHVAYDLFCEHGIDAVTILQISKKSKISLNSIYNYFDSKATLVGHTQKILWGEILAHIFSESSEQLSSAQNGYEEIQILLSNFKNFYENHSRYLLFSCDYNMFLIRHHLKLSQQFYEDIHAPVYETFCAALERGHNDGSISKSEEVNAQFCTLWSVMNSFVEQIVIFDEMYMGINPWKESFGLVLKYTLAALKSKE